MKRRMGATGSAGHNLNPTLAPAAAPHLQTECAIENCAGCEDPSQCDVCVPGYALEGGACVVSVEEGSALLAVGASAGLPAPSDKVRPLADWLGMEVEGQRRSATSACAAAGEHSMWAWCQVLLGRVSRACKLHCC